MYSSFAENDLQERALAHPRVLANACRGDSGPARRRRPLSEFAGAVTRERTSTTTTPIQHHDAGAPAAGTCRDQLSGAAGRSALGVRARAGARTITTACQTMGSP